MAHAKQEWLYVLLYIRNIEKLCVEFIGGGVVPPEVTGGAENSFSSLIISLLCGAIRIGMVVVVLCPNSFLLFHLGTRIQVLFYLLLIYQIIFRPPH